MHIISEERPVYEDFSESDDERTESNESKEPSNDSVGVTRMKHIIWVEQHSKDQIIGDPKAGVQTRWSVANYSLVSTIEPKTVAEARLMKAG